MKIVKNTTKIENRVLRSLICKVHTHMKRLEGRSAPNWKDLRIAIGNRTHGYSGRAFYNGNGWKDWDVFLSLPGDATERGTADLVYHELMHTYGYKHSEYSNIPNRELEKLFPANLTIGVSAKPKTKTEKAQAGEFPIKIRMTSHAISELSHAEYGSYEDWLSDNKEATEYNGWRTCHTVEILERHKTLIELRNKEELDEVYWAVNTGLFSMYCPSASDRLENELIRHKELK